MNIKYLEKDKSEITIIEKLWNKLNKLHSDLSPFFSNEYNNKTFNDRKNEILEKAKDGILKLFIAIDMDTEKIIGYCICSIVNNIGEIDSIFVDEVYRKHKIGDEFMIKSDNFFSDNSVNKQILSVYAGNENVIRFYNKHHYYQKYVILEKKRGE